MNDRLRAISERLEHAMLADRHRLRARLRGVERTLRQGREPGRAEGVGGILQRIVEDIDRSIARRERRAANLPRPTYPVELPVVERREEIARAIADNQVVVVCGETGSGKTTQLPKICLELGRGVAGLIGHTQPRRIAARSVATRIALELETPLGRAVGYKVRFGDKTSPDTYVKLMTDGILLAETQGDRFLEQYDTIIIDEAHERSLNIDFLLGYLRQLLPKRPDLKVIITSATIDPESFAQHFAGADGQPAPIVNVSGRTYPVEVRYRPPVAVDEEGGDEQDLDMESAILRAVDEIAQETPGDVLIFLPGEREIRETAEALRKHHVGPRGVPQPEILPLYARLSAEEQMRVFQPHGGRRIVLATNVAETSLTVPGIRAVVDPGVARVSRYSARTKVQRLPVEVVSRASANQRAGRCGRVGPGICIRLYSEQDFLERPEFMEPEILRTNLAAVILQMKALRLGAVEHFPFVQPPDPRAVKDGYETLHELGAVDERNELTDLGRQLARLPLDPRIGRMVLAANQEGSLAEVLVIAAALSIQDPRERPMEAQSAADQAHARFKDETSDFVALLNLWREHQEQAQHLSHSKLRKWCRENFVSSMRMREWADVHRQLHALVTEMGFHPNTKAADSDAVHRAVLAGLLGNVGKKPSDADGGGGFEYDGPRGLKFSIHPGSGLFKARPDWVVAAELVRTTRLYARTVARVKPEWIERLGEHLVKRTYSDPFWDRRGGRVMAYERVTLWGLELVAKRKVHYGPIDPAIAREVFIHHALADFNYATTAPFFEHNRALVDEVQKLEAKLRRTDLLADARERFAFYDARIPKGIYTAGAFERWRKQAEKENPKLLFMSREDLMRPGTKEIDAAGYPDAISVDGEAKLPLTYRLGPGEQDDGVTLTVPLEAVVLLDPNRTERMVPGLVKEKVTELVRNLPKGIRRTVDAAKIAEEIAAIPPEKDGPLVEAVAARIEKAAGVPVPRGALDPSALPEHLLLNYRVLDDRGRRVAEGRNLEVLKRDLAPQIERSLARIAGPELTRDGLTDWDFGDLPESVEFKRGPLTLHGHPALLDRGESVSLRVLENAEAARRLTHAGVRRLFMLQTREELKWQVSVTVGLERMVMNYAPLGPGSELKRDLATLIADRAFLADGGVVRTRAEFIKRLESGYNRLGVAREEVAKLIEKILEEHQAVALAISGNQPPAWEPVISDVKSQVAALAPKGFLSSVPWERLRHYPRYLAAIRARIRKLPGGGLARDLANTGQVSAAWKAYLARAEQHREAGVVDPALEDFRWLVEEYRVSLFAQELRTAAPVSPKRLAEAWSAVGA